MSHKSHLLDLLLLLSFFCYWWFLVQFVGFAQLLFFIFILGVGILLLQFNDFDIYMEEDLHGK